jgi:hypothetical protein
MPCTKERRDEEEEMRLKAAQAMAGVALMVCAGCGTNDSRGTATDTGSGGQQAPPMTLEGCLQEGGGTFRSGYLLTMINASPDMVGTTGSATSTGSSVQREQLQVAARTYRLDPKGDVKLDGMLGRQIRVIGTLSERAKVPNDKGASGNDVLGSDQGRQTDLHISTADLAKLDVTSATVIGEACGTTDRSSPQNSAPAADHEQGPRTGNQPR